MAFKTISSGNQESAKSTKDWKLEEVYTGYYLREKEVKTKIGDSTIYTFRDSDESGTDTGRDTSIWSCASIDTGMAKVKPKQLVRFTFKGKEVNANTGRTFMKFVIEADDDAFLDKKNQVPQATLSSEENDFEVSWDEDEDNTGIRV